MPETFFILLAGGVLLAAAVPDPKSVTLHWLRLAGILALCMAGLALLFFLAFREPAAGATLRFGAILGGQLAATTVAILAQLAFAQTDRRGAQRVCALVGFLLAVMAGTGLLHERMIAAGSATRFAPKAFAVALQALSAAGVAAMTGLVLMAMLLGHAYLTASRMTMAPFRRLNLALAATVVLRIAVAVGFVLLLQRTRPVELLWGRYGLFMLTRWLVGLAVPAVFVYMAHDCIRRRANQSATGILYVAGVLVFIGEIVALHLVRETGLPF
jgi:hypothetical protein